MLKVNTDPDCPGAGRAEKDYNLGRDRTHKDKGKYGYSHISPDRWNAIFSESASPIQDCYRPKKKF